jgi:hypothetical protein
VDWLTNHIVTIAFTTMYGVALFWILRLQFDPKYKNFDLLHLVTTHDGYPDGEKLRVYIAYSAGLFAFFYFMIHDHPVFVDYGKWFLLIALGHAVANRMTKDQSSPSPKGTP